MRLLPGKIHIGKGKKVIAVFLLLIIVLSIIIKNKIEPVRIDKNELAEIRIECLEGSTDINSNEEIADAVRKINSIKAVVKTDDGDVEYGHTPDAMIYCYDESGKNNHFIYFYGNVLLYDNLVLKIIGSADIQYNKLRKLCEKYGRITVEREENQSILSQYNWQIFLGTIILFVLLLTVRKVLLNQVFSG